MTSFGVLPQRRTATQLKYIVCIDFGTTRSGISWTIFEDNKGNPNILDMKISSCPAESSINNSANPDKCPTIITFRASEDQIGPDSFLQATDDGEIGHYANDFKMNLDVLSRRKNEKDVKLASTNITLIPLQPGTPEKQMLLIDVVSRYLKVAGDIGFENIRNSAEEAKVRLPKREDIQWVVTVPAIWTDQARIFMREAAIKAKFVPGDDTFSTNISICLEPEGAALHCFSQMTSISENAELKNKNLIIIDLGGGTADITTHKITSYSPSTRRVQLDEIIPPSGGPWGGRLIEEYFEKNILKPLLDDKQYKTYLNSSVRMEFLLKEFLKVKTLFSDKNENYYVNLSLINNHMNLSKGMLKHNLEKVNCKLDNNKKISINNFRLKIPLPLVKEMISQITNPLCSHLREVIDSLKSQGIKLSYALLVGGMGSNSLVYSIVKQCISKYSISITPTDLANIAVVLGGARFGYDTDSFGARKARTNYGIELWNEEDAYNPFFRKIITKGENLSAIANTTHGPFRTIFESQTTIPFRLYESDAGDVEYVHDSGVAFIVEVFLNVNMAVPLSERIYTVKLSMDGTVITGQVTDVSNGNSTMLKWSSW